MNSIKQSLKLGNRNLTLETGEIGRQAQATVICSLDDTVVLAAVTNSSSATTQNFLPLAVDYQEKAYAAGKFPGGYFKREGRPSEKEVLIGRLIDRSIRPLFPSLYRNEINVNCAVLSYNPEVEADIPAMIASFAACVLSGIPISSTLGAVRVAIDANDNPIVCPTIVETENSKLELVMAGSEKGIVMVESEAKNLSEDKMIDCLEVGHKAIQDIIGVITKLNEENGNKKQEWEEPKLDEGIKTKLNEVAPAQFKEAYQILDKQERANKLKEIKSQLALDLIGEEAEVEVVNLFDIATKKIQADVVRSGMLSGGKRIDGRDFADIREITIRTGVLPRTHGSALFTRGETQALVVCTLGTGRDEQKIDSLGGEIYDRFIMHYNMPPYATGETGRAASPKRREIGHGRLAKRAIVPVLPKLDDFGYSIRLVSEITESNGSSSMASVCGGSLSLMDAGVTTSEHVAGIAMGLVYSDDDNYVILSDILGDEDHLGDMDFKVAGTKNGITALQMDIKIDSVNRDLLAKALNQAKDARLHIIGKMDEALAKPREEFSDYAPSILKMKIKVEKIREVIGKGGATINKLTEETQTKIDIDEDGTITISGPTSQLCKLAKTKIEGITTDAEKGQVYDGEVNKILEFGAIVSILPGIEGLLHISKISNERIEKVTDHLSVGQQVRVKVIQAERGRYRLSMIDLDENEK